MAIISWSPRRRTLRSTGGNFILTGVDVADAPRWVAVRFAWRISRAPPTSRSGLIDVPEVDAALRAVGLRQRRARTGRLRGADSRTALAGTAARRTGRSSVVPLSTDADWAQTLDVTLVTHEITEPREVEFATRKQAEMRAVTEAGHGAWFGAFVDSQVRATLGILTDGAGLGRFQSVETHPEFRRRGLARALITSAAASIQREFGVGEFVIVADPEYHAAALYRSVGFEPHAIQVQVGAALEAISGS